MDFQLSAALDWLAYIVAAGVLLELVTRHLVAGPTGSKLPREDGIQSHVRRFRPARIVAGIAVVGVFTSPSLLDGVAMFPWLAFLKEPVFYAITGALSLVLERPAKAGEHSHSGRDERQSEQEQLDKRLTELIQHFDRCEVLCIDMRSAVRRMTPEAEDVVADPTSGTLLQELTHLDQLVEKATTHLHKWDATAITGGDS